MQTYCEHFSIGEAATKLGDVSIEVDSFNKDHSLTPENTFRARGAKHLLVRIINIMFHRYHHAIVIHTKVSYFKYCIYPIYSTPC
jgi:hypothetical protein